MILDLQGSLDIQIYDLNLKPLDKKEVSEVIEKLNNYEYFLDLSNKLITSNDYITLYIITYDIGVNMQYSFYNQ